MMGITSVLSTEGASLTCPVFIITLTIMLGSQHQYIFLYLDFNHFRQMNVLKQNHFFYF